MVVEEMMDELMRTRMMMIQQGRREVVVVLAMNVLQQGSGSTWTTRLVDKEQLYMVLDKDKSTSTT